jgi:hypothetical protein
MIDKASAWGVGGGVEIWAMVESSARIGIVGGAGNVLGDYFIISSTLDS